MYTNKSNYYRLGVEKSKTLLNNFDAIYDSYKRKAKRMNHNGEVKLIKEKSKVIFYMTLENKDIYNPIINFKNYE